MSNNLTLLLNKIQGDLSSSHASPKRRLGIQSFDPCQQHILILLARCRGQTMKNSDKLVDLGCAYLYIYMYIYIYICMGVSKNRGTPKWMVKIMENPIKMDDLGVPPFKETPISSWQNFGPLLVRLTFTLSH